VCLGRLRLRGGGARRNREDDQALGVQRARAHRAEDDVHALRGVFRKILEVLAPCTPRDLWHVRVGQRHARPELLAAALGALEREETVLVRYRPAHRAPEELQLRVTPIRKPIGCVF